MIVRPIQCVCLSIIFSLCLSFSVMAAQSSKVKAMSDQELLVEVIKLDLGFEQYRIGQTLTDAQFRMAQKNSVKNRYQGTIKYMDGDVAVVADAENKNIIALYIETKEASQEQIKNMVATLMMSFGQPTTMAHEKIVYWAYNEDGLIPEEVHGNAKKIDELNIIATVKFNSKTRFMEKVKTVEKGKEEKIVEEEKNSIYCIVSSPAMLERFSAK